MREEIKPVEELFPAVIYYTGTVNWYMPIIYRSSCIMEVTNFPWDQQICKMKFGSWSYDGTKVDFKNRSLTGDVSHFLDNGEWELLGMPMRVHVIYYGCCPEPYPDVTFYIIIRRKPLYYIFNLVIPAVFLTITTVLAFYLPPESGEKVSLGVTVLLALTVFLLLVDETLPPQSDTIPLIGEILILCIVSSLISAPVYTYCT